MREVEAGGDRHGVVVRVASEVVVGVGTAACGPAPAGKPVFPLVVVDAKDDDEAVVGAWRAQVRTEQALGVRLPEDVRVGHIEGMAT